MNLVRRNAVRIFELTLEATAELTATTTVRPNLPWLAVLSKMKDDAALTVRGLEVDIIEANRYRIDDIDASQVVDAFGATLIGSLSGKIVDQLNASSRARTFAALTFARTPSLSLPLLERAATVAGSSRLEFIRLVNPNLRLGERRIEGIAADQPVNLAAMVSATTIEELRLVNDAAKPGLPALVVSGHATAHSLQLDGRELMPTRLDEILNAPVSDRTLMLLGLGALAAVLLKVLDRALSVLLVYVLPEGFVT